MERKQETSRRPKSYPFYVPYSTTKEEAQIEMVAARQYRSPPVQQDYRKLPLREFPEPEPSRGCYRGSCILM